jgi:phage terminase large subunit-like protein
MFFDEFVKRSGVVRPSEEDRMKFVSDIIKENPEYSIALKNDFLNIWARDIQVPYYFSNSWKKFAAIAGRGIGKTRLGSEWLRYLVFNRFKEHPISIGVIVPIQGYIDKISVNGESGIMNVLSDSERAQTKYNINGAFIRFDNGSSINYYSAENIDRIRGENFSFIWADELAAWDEKKIDDILIMIRYCLRIRPPEGHVQMLITTTPKPQPWVRDLFRDSQTNDEVVIAQESTYANAANLDPEYLKEILKDENSDIGQQEIHGKVLLTNEKGIIKREWIKLWDVDQPLPKLKFVFGSYDLAATEKKENDPSGCIILGAFEDRDYELSYILLDCWNEHLEYSDQRKQMLIDWNDKYGDRPINKKKPLFFVVEAKSNGLAILGDLNRLGVKMLKYSPGAGDDKHSRLNSVAHYFENGRFYIPESRKHRGTPHPKFKHFYDEVCDFPLVRHDEYPDCVSQAFIVLAKQNMIISDMSERDDEEPYDFFAEEEQFREKKSNPYMNC